MATILGGDVTVEYLDNNRMKMLYWSGTTATYTMNELYSAMGTLLDESDTIDDGTCFSAETPVEYTIGKIDAGDTEPWYATFDLMEHINGGALRTSGWTRATGTNAGIIVVPVTASGSTIVDADRGKDISGGTDGNGTLLEYIDTGGTNDYCVIRPDSSASGDDFTTNSQTLTCNGHTSTQAQAGSTTGEMIWANLYSIGTIESDTHIYLYQGIIADDSRERVSSWNDATQDWWGDGHIDICVPIKDITQTTWSIIDGGYVSVFARKGGTLYDNFETTTSTTSGGRNPIPLATAVDLDNPTGYKSITTTAVGTDDFAVGNEIEGGTSGARGIITNITGTSPTYTFHYYLIDDPLTDFQTAAETITNNDATGSATKDGNAPANQGPALSTWFTANTFPTIGAGGHTYVAYDVDDDSTDENYGVTIDCNQNPLTEVYEWLKYITRRGNTTTTDTDGIAAEQYIGGEVYLSWTGSVTGTIAEGADVTQETSGATGIIQAYDATAKVMLLRNTRGTFITHATTATLTDNDNSGTVEIDGNAIAFSPKKASPFGTFAGGTFFGARGVLLSDWLSADENSFILAPIEGGTKERPQAISISITNLVGTDETTSTDDRVGLFRLTGDGEDIDKMEYSAAGGESIGDTTLVVDTAITQDTPGKTTGGTLVIRDASDDYQEYYLRYSSWSTSTFTLTNIDIAAADGGSTTTVIESGAFTNAKRGDLVYNHDLGEVTYVKTVDSANQITVYPAFSEDPTGDHIELNCVPISMNTADEVYVPLIRRMATSSSESVSVIYVSPLYIRAKVRNTRATTKIKPFSVDTSSTGSDVSIATIRTEDTIISA